MLEGLEATEVRFEKVLNGVETVRFDSEYYKKEYTQIETFIANNPTKFERFSDLGITIDCSAFYAGVEPFYGQGNMPLIRVQNVKESIDYDGCVKLPFLLDSQYSTLKTVNEGDIVITKGGSIALVGYVTKTAYVSRDLIFIKSSVLAEEQRIFLYLYLSTPFAYKQLIRSSSQCAQPHLTITLVKNFDLLKANYDVISKCSSLYKKSVAASSESKSLYCSAESYLLECLGMKDFAANPNSYNTLSLKESFLETGRFDAEYYLPKYEDYCKLIQSYSNGYELLKTACDIQDINYTPEAGQLYKYVELADIGKSGEITGCDINKGENLPTRARRMIHTNDVIVSSIEGSLDSCALVTDDYDGALCSTGFHVLQSSKLNPETLLTLFKALPIQQLMKKGCSGTILTAINKPELEKLPIPIIRTEIQQEIAKHIQQSFTLRKKALQLLENAKLTVEQSIENRGGNLLIYNKLSKQSIQEYRMAMWLLLIEIGVATEDKIVHQVISTTKKLSDSFLCSGRFDAEYYQPKYDYLFKKLSDYETLALGDLVDIHKSIEPGSDAYDNRGIPFVRVSDLSKFGLSETSIFIDKENYADVIRPAKDTILMSKDGSVGIAYKTEENLDVITSGAILHLKIKSTKVQPDYLTLVLNSVIVQLQAERDAGGSIIQHWKPSEIEDVKIPILPLVKQTTISNTVQRSFELRKESRCLLEEAKAIVERTIEIGL